MVARNRGRYLAPIALIAAIVATILIVQGGLATKHHAIQVQTVDSHAVQHRAPTHVVMFYVIHSGDSLSSIAAKTGISVATLEALNPSLDPYAMQTGQRLRLRR